MNKVSRIHNAIVKDGICVHRAKSDWGVDVYENNKYPGVVARTADAGYTIGIVWGERLLVDCTPGHHTKFVFGGPEDVDVLYNAICKP